MYGQCQRGSLATRLMPLLGLVLTTVTYADVATGKRAFDLGDYTTALREFRASARIGEPEAEAYLGRMYLGGFGLRRNTNEAIRWYTLAGDSGFVGAASILAYLYWNGSHGVAKNYSEAIKWATSAAAHGDAKACLLLGVMYSEGQGVPRDFTQAYLWTSVAAQTSGHEDVSESAISEELDFLSYRMTLKEVLLAELLVRDRREGPANLDSHKTEIPGLYAEDFHWEQGCRSVGTRFSVAIRNSSSGTVANFRVRVVFLDRDKKPIDFQVLTFDGAIPAGLTKRVASEANEQTRKLACEEMTSLIELLSERVKRQSRRQKQSALMSARRQIGYVDQAVTVDGDAELATRFARIGLTVLANTDP